MNQIECLQSALITGGSRGIGLGIAKELAKAGFNLAINGVRGQESVQHVLRELSTFGVKVIYAQGDVSQKPDRENIIKTDMTAGVRQKYDDLFEKGMAIQKRWGLPEDVGKVAAAMALGYLPYSTGQVVMVDGGMTIKQL